MDSVDKLDLMFGSLSGAALDMASQWYSDSTFQDVARRAGGKTTTTTPGTPASHSKTFPYKNTPAVPGTTTTTIGDATDDIVDKHGQRHKNRYNSRSHPFRNALNKLTGGVVESTSARSASYAKELALRDWGRGAAKSGIGMAGALDGDDVNKLKNAVKFRNLSIGITGVWGVAMGASVANSALSSVREKGAAEMGRRWGMNQEGFADSKMAYTSRQRALRAIQSSQSGMRRSFGNEANFLHSYK